MNPFIYALFTYGLTAVLSFLVIGIIVLINRLMSGSGENKEE